MKRPPTRGKLVVQGPGENAGVVDIGDGLVAAFKIESHNHPSYVEPFQGATTGVGGILRDIFTMGARPIAVLDSLRFGEVSNVAATFKSPSPNDETPAANRRILDGVIRGIANYGNCFGVPTVGGEVADGGNAEAVAVVGDAADYAVEDAAIGGGGFVVGAWRLESRRYVGDFAEAKGVEDGYGAGAHGEDVAEDAADAGGGALEGFDVAGVIVGFDFEGGDEAVTDVDYASVFAGTLHD